VATFSQTWSQNWQNLNLKFPERRIRRRFEKVDFDSLKAEYVKEYGYTVVIPQWDDIIRWKPKEMMTRDEIKDFKRRGLTRILASPAPEFYRNYSSVMTWIDNIQDTASVIYPFFRMLVRWAPKIFTRFIPYFGWGLLAYDLLQLANAIGRAPFAALRAKRAVCEPFRNNPFGKMAQRTRMERIAKWNPKFSDLLQVLQVTADTTGVGLSLGSLMGFIPDLFSGLYRKITGERVSFFTQPPTPNLYELNAHAAMKAAAIINSSEETFEEEMHFWSLATWAASVYIATPWIEFGDIAGSTEEVGAAILEAPEPEDPITRELIQEQGLSLSAGVGWPANGGKKIPALELSDWILDRGKTATKNYFLRHQKDSYGLIASHMVDQALGDLFDAAEPASTLVEEDTPIMHIFFQMLKQPMIPVQPTTPTQWQSFEDWVNFYVETNEAYPKMSTVRDKLNELGIPYVTAFPQTMDPSVKNFWPHPFDDSMFA